MNLQYFRVFFFFRNPTINVIPCLQVTQLEELLAVRHSVFVVGGPGTGKSQVNLTNEHFKTVCVFVLFFNICVIQLLIPKICPNILTKTTYINDLVYLSDLEDPS